MYLYKNLCLAYVFLEWKLIMGLIRGGWSVTIRKIDFSPLWISTPLFLFLQSVLMFMGHCANQSGTPLFPFDTPLTIIICICDKKKIRTYTIPYVYNNISINGINFEREKKRIDLWHIYFLLIYNNRFIFKVKRIFTL